ncbi:MAG TPA: hypothetical protein VHO69_11635, partial [Phototrophicaceae bacterium]|nr:hypothetical protein [Phototrophicaceae bacterium]
NVNTVASFVLRMVGNVPGMMPSVETAVDYMAAAGLTRMVEHSVADMMDELGQARPVDVISIMVAHKPTVEEAAQAEVQPIFISERKVAEPEPLLADTPASHPETTFPEIKDSDKEHPIHPHLPDVPPPPPGLD